MKVVLFISLLTLFLASCGGRGIGPAAEAVNIAKDKAIVSNYMDAAKRGDALAQYKVGDAYCCSVHEGSGFYNTPIAVRWLCASARQGHGPAMFKLGKIYSGDVVDGVRLIRRAAHRIAGTSENLTVAYVWLKQAADRSVKEATNRATRVWNDMATTERTIASRLLQDGPKAKCRWDEVIVKRK